MHVFSSHWCGTALSSVTCLLSWDLVHAAQQSSVEAGKDLQLASRAGQAAEALNGLGQSTHVDRAHPTTLARMPSQCETTGQDLREWAKWLGRRTSQVIGHPCMKLCASRDVVALASRK